MMRFQEAYQKKNGPLRQLQGDPAHQRSRQDNVLQNAGYKFELTVESDGFKIVATPATMAGAASASWATTPASYASRTSRRRVAAAAV